MAEWMLYARAIFALIFVAGLIVLLGAMAKKYGLDKRLTGSKNTIRRLSIVETLYLDPKNRLVIVRLGKKEHVLLLGAAGNSVVESRELNDTHEKS
jgi:flagellar protein FliO/FliZ